MQLPAFRTINSINGYQGSGANGSCSFSMFNHLLLEFFSTPWWSWWAGFYSLQVAPYSLGSIPRSSLPRFLPSELVGGNPLEFVFPLRFPCWRFRRERISELGVFLSRAKSTNCRSCSGCCLRSKLHWSVRLPWRSKGLSNGVLKGPPWRFFERIKYAI